MGSNKLLYDLDAERAVLSACMVDADVARFATESMESDDFMRIAHKRIFEAVSSLVGAGRSVDVLTVAHQLAANGTLEEIRGRNYLLDLADDRISLLGWRDHVRIVREYSVQRRIARAAALIIGESCRPQEDFEGYLERMRKLFDDAMGPKGL